MEKETYTFDFSAAAEKGGKLCVDSSEKRPCDYGLGPGNGPNLPCSLEARQEADGSWRAWFWFPDSYGAEAEGAGKHLPAAFDDMGKKLQEDYPWIRLRLGWSD